MPVIAGKIGINEFTTFELEPASYASVTEVLKRPGTDFHAVKLQGKEYPEQELTTQQEFNTHAVAVAATITYNSYIGTNQSLIRGGQAYGTYKFLKPFGSHYPKVLPPNYSGKFVGSPSGLNSGWIVKAVFLVQRVS